jgi:hypothetical protein
MKKLVLILALVACGRAEAGELTAGVLYSFCTTNDKVTRTACRFYVLGVVQGIELGDGAVLGDGGRFTVKKKTIFCAPENTQDSQFVDIFQQSMKKLMAIYPDDAKLSAVGVIGAAMKRAFPCPQ